MTINHLVHEKVAQWWKPQRGWASAAQILTYTLSAGPCPGGRVGFVENPSGGLACCDTDHMSIFINGHALEGKDALIPVFAVATDINPKQGLVDFAPSVIAAFWHEVGHLLTPSTVLMATIDHPKSQTANTVLNEVVADSAGVAEMQSRGVHEDQGVAFRGTTNETSERMLTLLAHVTNLETITEEGVDNAEYVLTFATQHFYRLGIETESALAARAILGDEHTEELRGIIAEADILPGRPFERQGEIFQRLMERWCAILDQLDPEAAEMERLRKAVAKATIEQMGAEEAAKAEAVEQAFEEVALEASMDYAISLKRDPPAEERPPTGGDWALRTRLREALVHLNYPDIARTEGWETAPPGRLSGARAMQRDALNEIDPFLGASVSPFRRVDRRADPMVPISVGVIIDQSGSMTALSETTTSLGWALAGAVRDVDGKVAVASMSSTGRLIEDSYSHKDQVVNHYPADGSFENFYEAWEAVTTAIDLENAPGVRLLIVATDWELVRESQSIYTEMALTRFRHKGGIVMSIHEAYNNHFDAHIDVSVKPDAAVQGVIDIYQSIRTRKEHR